MKVRPASKDGRLLPTLLILFAMVISRPVDGSARAGNIINCHIKTGVASSRIFEWSALNLDQISSTISLIDSNSFQLTDENSEISTTPVCSDDERQKKDKNKKENSTRAGSPREEAEKIPLPGLHEEILVTATMSPVEIKNCAVSASVVSGDKLKAVASTSALNALMFEPGIFIMRTGDFGRSDIEIRGLGQRGQRIGVMVDGRPEKMGIFGCVVSQTFPFDNVERLEVLRGPASVFYGSDALGGMVNIITHTPARGFENEAVSSYGSFDTLRFTLRHGAGFKNFKYYFTFDRSRSDGHLPDSSYSASSLTGKFIYNLSPRWTISLSGKYYDGLKNEPTILIPNPPAENWFDFKRGAVDLSLNRQGEQTDLSLKVYADFGRHRFSDGWNSRDEVFGGLVKFSLSSIKNNQLTAGADFRRLQGKSFNFPVGQWHRTEAGFFLHDQLTIPDRLVLTGDLRLNLDSTYGTEFAPSAGFVFFIRPEISIRGLVSKGFRSPQLNELYLFPASNPDLKPEILWNYEVGFSARPGQRFDLSCNLFFMKGRDFIELRPNPSPPPMYRMVNVGEYQARGIEAIISGYLNQNLQAIASVTLLDPEENTAGKAGQKYDLSLLFRRGRIFLGLTAQYVTDYYAGNDRTQPLPSFFLLHYKLEYSLSRYFSLLFSLNNILDTDYQIYVNLPEGTGPYPMPGRSFNLGLRIKP